MRGSIINNTIHICIGSVPTVDYGICKVIMIIIIIIIFFFIIIIIIIISQCYSWPY